MTRSWRSWLVIPVCLGMLLLGSIRLAAEDAAAPAQAAAPAAPAGAGCPYAGTAEGCTDCPHRGDCPHHADCPRMKDQAAQPEADCPCKHAQQGENKNP
jgi:hypothetical protein